MKKRILALTLALSLLLPACSGGEAKAATMHLRRTEGTVAVSDDSGTDVPLLDDLGLYSGYGVDTSSESYAWIDLDAVKLTKMDQDSEIAITKEGKKLEVEVKAGSLFFNVTEPLADDETMNIRTSTMIVGIRGTCGWVTQDTVALLEGTVEVTAGEQSVTISAGEMAFLTEDGILEVRKLYEEDVPAFVAEEIGDRFQLEPAPVIPYAEANGLSFSKEKGYTIPAFTSLGDLNGEPASFDGLSISGVVDASYTIEDVSISEADADGMVQITIPYHVNFTTTITDDSTSEENEEFRYGWSFSSLGLFDYYTGIIFPTNGTLYDGSTLENAIDITYQDIIYPIAYTRSMTSVDDSSDWVNVDGDIYELQITVSADTTYTIHMPEEYDGLCLFLYLPGKTEFSEDREDSSEISYLLEAIEEDGGNVSDYVLMRVSDLM